jgi:nucleoside-diphosphate-sugar epimerase
MDDLIDTYRPEAIINFAACAGVRYSMQDPFIFFRVNTDGHLHLLELARKYDIKKVILASTSSLYAGCELPFKESLPVNEPISPYAASKKGAEAISYTYHYLYGLDTIIFRYFTVYGPAGRPDMCMFRFIEWATQDKPLILYGDGSQYRDFTFVDDIARGTIMGLGISGHKIINLGGDETHSVNEVIDEIKGNLNKPVSVVAKAFHKADMQATSADISIARSYGWSPKVNFKEGIKRTVNWHNQNRKLLDKINLGDT